MDRLDEVLTDLAAESDALDAVVASLDEDAWRIATPSDGWDVAAQIAHLAWGDEATVAAVGGGAAWDELSAEVAEGLTERVDRAALEGGAVAPSELLARWRRSRAVCAEALRSVPAGTRVAWFGPPMSPVSMATARFMETWAHSADVHEALGIEPPLTDRVRHVAFLGVITRGFAFAAHGRRPPDEPVHVRLTLPSGAEWQHGDESAADRVTGSAQDFALRVTQRRHRADLDLVAQGPVADAWLDVAQAFAGPPGAGRPPAR